MFSVIDIWLLLHLGFLVDPIDKVVNKDWLKTTKYVTNFQANSRGVYCVQTLPIGGDVIIWTKILLTQIICPLDGVTNLYPYSSIDLRV